MSVSGQTPDTLPHEFMERLREIIVAPSWDDFWSSFQYPSQFGVRINTLRSDRESVESAWREQGLVALPVEWLPGAYSMPWSQRELLVRSAWVESGAIYIQNLSSMLAVEVLGAVAGEQVLDLAAAPGGKTTQLAAKMNNQGWLSAVEPIRTRFFKLQATLKRYGVTIGHTYLTDGRTVGRKTPERFDRVLLDAPCSGEARFRTSDPDTFAFWSPRKIREQSRKQRGLLLSAFEATRPGGRLLYCTCSFAPEENEAIVSELLRTHPHRARVEPVDLPITNWQPGRLHWQGRDYDPQVTLARRILPTSGMDAFFLCLIRKHD